MAKRKVMVIPHKTISAVLRFKSLPRDCVPDSAKPLHKLLNFADRYGMSGERMRQLSKHYQRKENL